MPKKQTENLSKRQARKEELRKREIQQRRIMIGGIAVVAVILLAVIIIPSIQQSKNPGGEIVKITPQTYPTGNGTTIGNPDAKVKVDVFSDFQCSACATYANDIEPQVIREIIEPNDVYYVYHQFPFLDDSDPNKTSDRTALASECAAEQGRFWDYKAILYANQTGIEGQFSDPRLSAFAKNLGLDLESFEACLASAKYQNVLDEGVKLGTELGVTGTPSVFVNGQNVSPGRVSTFDEINALVLAALQGN